MVLDLRDICSRALYLYKSYDTAILHILYNVLLLLFLNVYDLLISPLQEVLEILASSDVIEHTATIYFTTIHTWFSFISRKRMNLGISLADGGPDLALLFLAMKLITTTPEASSSSPDQQTHLYATTKRFLALLEAAGTVSIFYLQAMTLIALYEYGHAIYPAAWMTVGSCVRYAAMLGLPSYGEASSVLGPCVSPFLLCPFSSSCIASWN